MLSKDVERLRNPPDPALVSSQLLVWMGIWNHPDDFRASRWLAAAAQGRLLWGEVQALARLEVRESLVEICQHGLGVVLELEQLPHVPPQQGQLVLQLHVALGWASCVLVESLWPNLRADARVERCPLAWDLLVSDFKSQEGQGTNGMCHLACCWRPGGRFWRRPGTWSS